MKLHHATLKAASARYRPMIEAGKTSEEIKILLAADDKTFAPEAIEEIMADLFPDNNGSGEGSKNPNPNPNPNPDDKDLDNKDKSENKKGDEGDDTKNSGKDDFSDNKQIGKSFIVINAFRDISDFSKEYAVGSDVSHFDEKRLNNLIEKGLIEKK